MVQNSALGPACKMSPQPRRAAFGSVQRCAAHSPHLGQKPDSRRLGRRIGLVRRTPRSPLGLNLAREPPAAPAPSDGI